MEIAKEEDMANAVDKIFMNHGTVTIVQDDAGFGVEFEQYHTDSLGGYGSTKSQALVEAAKSFEKMARELRANASSFKKEGK
jgi:hypothetical protein